MTADEQAKVEQIERERRRREAAILALLLLWVSGSATLAGATRRHPRNALRAALDSYHTGGNPAQAVTDVLRGNPALHLPGLKTPLSLALGEVYIAGYARAFTLLDLPKPPPPDPTEAMRMAEQRAQDTIDALVAGMTGVIQQAIADGRLIGLTTPQVARAIADAMTKYGYTGKAPQTVNPDSVGSAAFNLIGHATDSVLDVWGGGMWRAILNLQQPRGEVGGAISLPMGEGGEETPSPPKVIITALRHYSVLDDSTSDYCDEHSGRPGLTLPPDHPYWRTNWPQLHPRCRSIVAPLNTPVEFSDTLPTIPAAPGWGIAPQ